MPVPAEPAPSTATRCSVSGVPVTLMALEQRADSNRGGALDVVVEGAQAVAIARQQPIGVADGEIFPVQQHVRPALAYRGDEGGDEVVVLIAAHALVLPADILRIVQMRAAVGADVENDRQSGRRMQPGARRVERKLADRNAHAAGALVAEAEDALAVADDDGLDAIEARIGEDAANILLVRIAQKQAARLAKDAGELLAAEPDRRRIDDRHHLFDVARQQCVKQGLVAVL